jgi:ubiquinone/menaquinone biosynthesis C-methylase UbiE
MDTKIVYSTKAQKYAKYRWDFAMSAVEAIVEMTHLDNQSVIADIGAGTGILTRHFTNCAHQIYAVEPNQEMRDILIENMADKSNVSVINGCAENTLLANDSVDLITAAQAIHWFDPEPAKKEMLRILKDDGWLVLLRNYPVNQAYNEAVGSLISEHYGADFSVAAERPKPKPTDYYYGTDHFRTLTFPFHFNQSWKGFIGALTTASFMPDEDHPLFGKLEAKAREVFAQLSRNGMLLVEGETELIIGQPQR